MSTELTMLALGVLLGIVHVFVPAWVRSLKAGPAWSAGARDEKAPPLGKVGERLFRAQANFMETFPFFAAAVLLVQVSAQNSALTAICAHVWFWCRLAYLPLYAAGVPVVRSLVWIASCGAIVTMIVGALL